MTRTRAGTIIGASVLVLALAAGCDGPPAASSSTTATPAPPTRIAALGRIEPKDGVRRVAGPSGRPSAVIAKLLVEEGDRVAVDQPLAVLDTLAEDAARVTRARAELANARTALGRLAPLVKQGIAPVQARDDAQLKVDVAEAELAAAQAALDLDTVRAPNAGQVIAIRARRGERIGPDGVAEIAENDRMYAVAEVYETDVGRVKLGQRATLRSPALDRPLTGRVERIGMKIGKLDLLDADPIARTDARVVEVRIALDDSPRAATLSNLQVETLIEP